MIQNPNDKTANIDYELRSRSGAIVYTGTDTIPSKGVKAVRPRNLVGSDFYGSVIVRSDQPIVGTSEITRNDNEMCMSFSAVTSYEMLHT